MVHRNAFLLALALSIAPAHAEKLLVKAGKLVDVRNSRVEADRAILVEDGRIVAVGPAEEIRARGKDARVIDLSRFTVLPGLIDVHDHVFWHFNKEGRLHTDKDGETAVQAELAAAGNAYATLMAGFTTIESPGSPEDKDLRDAIDRGVLPGPRILTSLEPLSGEDGDPAKLRELVRERKAQGADFIKVFASQSIRQGGAQSMSDAQLEALCGEARSLGLRTLVHAHSAASMRAASAAGCTQIEHGVFATPEVLRFLADRGTYFDPQCRLIFRNYLEHKSNYLGIDNYTEAGFAAMEKAIPLAADVYRKAIATPGLKVVFGTDAVAGAHGRNADDLLCRVEAGGQRPIEAIVSATRVAAESMGLQERIGSLEPGRDADIIAVFGDPSVEISTLLHVEFVMRGGKIFRMPLADR